MVKNILKFSGASLVVFFLVYYVSFQAKHPYLANQYVQAGDGDSEKSSKSSEQEYEIIKEERAIVIEPEKVVYETRLKSITLPDSDRDGIADEYDEYPEMPVIYLVKDENLNGIVDIFEGIFE